MMKDSSQLSLFDENSKKPNKENELLWAQLIRLGDMMGDGLHHEPDGKWISKEYRKISRILIPKIKEKESAIRKLKSVSINAQMERLLEGRKCECGGEIKQGRSGTKVAYCQNCKQRYVVRSKKS